MIPVCYRFNVMFFKFLLIHKTLSFFMLYITWQKLAREKWRHEVAKTLRGFVFILELSFYVQR